MTNSSKFSKSSAGSAPHKPSGSSQNGKRFHGPVGNRKGMVQKSDDLPGLPARRIALRILRQVTEEGAWASLSLDAALADSGLSAVDRRLVSRLVYDTLDRMTYLDWALAQVMAKPDTDIRLRNILRLGACQILLEDRIPESAATNTSVQLCSEAGIEGLKGVCNGILRNLIRRKELLLLDRNDHSDSNLLLLSGLPSWLYDRLKKEYGKEAILSLASGHRQEEGWMIRPNLLNMTDSDLEERLKHKVWHWEKGKLPHTYHITGAMNIGQDADFLSGHFSIQTVGSIMTCLTMGPRRGETILDCCAAPGGKSCLMAEMMGGTGRVQAWDLHEHRTSLIAAQVRRLGLENVRPMTRDATKPRPDLTAGMDGVLIDAPCTGTGMIMEKPDLKGRLTENGLSDLCTLQQELLETVSGYVRPGGRLVYSTCSALKEENSRQVASFLKRHPEFEPAPLPESIPEFYRKAAMQDGEDLGLQLLPWTTHTEGFYLCRLNRKSDS